MKGGIVMRLLAWLCLVASLTLVSGASAEDAAEKPLGQIPPRDTTPLNERVTITPLILQDLNGNLLAAGGQGVLLLRVANVSSKPAHVWLSRWNNNFLGRPSFVLDGKNPPREYTPLVIEWYRDDKLVYVQKLPLADIDLPAAGKCKVVLGVNAPKEPATYNVLLTLNNEEVLHATGTSADIGTSTPPENHLVWRDKLADVRVESTAPPLEDSKFDKRMGYGPDWHYSEDY
jgi:hypothetical protein